MSQSSKRRSPVLKVVRNASVRMRGHVEGWLAELGTKGAVVDYPDNPHGPLLAKSTVARASLQAARTSASERCAVLLVFEQERSDRPVIVGLLHAAEPMMEAVVDGRRVVIDGQDEIVLRCGEASITLRRNGRVVIRGAYVETRARGVNRIKGGSVQIN